jgi:pyruvate/2-oxoglutarate dehydrogenase complex dihydrolipoamide acyltransferase (E2) component
VRIIGLVDLDQGVGEMGKYWEPLEKYSSWRKISVGMWGSPNDPTIYGYETLDVSRLLPYLEEVSRISGTKVTMPAYLAAVVSTILDRHPALNVMVVGKRIQRRKSVDIFCQVAVPNEDAGQADLSGVKLAECPKMDLVSIAKRLRSRASDVREGQDEEMERTKSMIDIVPSWLIGGMLKMVDFLTYNVPVDLDGLGIRSDPFGSAMITSVAQFDIKLGFAPLVPASRVPLVFLPGAVHKATFINDDDEVEVRDAIKCSCTFDHRCFDGYQIGYIVRNFRDMVSNPRDHFPDPSYWAETDVDEQARRPEDQKAAAVPAE